MSSQTALAGDVVFFLAETTLQSALLFTLVWLISRSLGARSAALRSTLWLMALVCPVVVPLLSHIVLPRFALELHLRALEQALAWPIAWLTAHQLAAALVAGGLLALLFGLDLARWAACALRVGRGGSHGRASPQAARCAAALPQICRRLAVGRLPAVHVDDRGPTGIYTLRWPRPCIYLSGRLAERLDDEELRAALAHEAAHLQRRDWLRLCVAQLFRDLAWFNPFAHLAYRAYRQATEEAADDASAITRPERIVLASSLLKAQTYLQGTRRVYASLSFLQPATDVASRVKRLMSPESQGPAPRDQRWAAWGVLAVALLLATVI